MTSQKIRVLFHAYIGHLLVIGFLVGGYLYNVKFIQLGIPDLGKARLGMDATTVSLLMALLAVVTAIVAIAWGLKVDKLQLSLARKIDILIVVGLAQLGLTIWTAFMTTPVEFPAWIVLTSIVLGIGIPVSFPLLFELIPYKDRGLVAGLIAGLAFFISNISPFSWDISGTTQEALVMMVPGLAAFLLLRGLGYIDKWFPPKVDYANHAGRFTRRHLLSIVVLVFVVFFVDSLGFLRIIGDTPLYDQTWHSALQERVILGIVHLLAGIGAGVLYSKTNEWTLGILAIAMFAAVDACFSLYSPSMSSMTTLSLAAMYCAAVSIYTTITFAIWADVSTRENAARNAGIGIGIGGWLSTFSSTMLAGLLTPVITFQVHIMIPSIIAAAMLVIFAILFKNRRDLLLGNEIAEAFPESTE